MGPLNAVLGRGGEGGSERLRLLRGGLGAGARQGRQNLTPTPRPRRAPPSGNQAAKYVNDLAWLLLFWFCFFSNHHVVSGPRFEETVPCVPSFLLPRGFREPKIASNIAQKTPTWLKIAHIMPCL